MVHKCSTKKINRIATSLKNVAGEQITGVMIIEGVGMRLSVEQTLHLCTYDVFERTGIDITDLLENYTLIDSMQIGEESFYGVTPMRTVYRDSKLNCWMCLWNKVCKDGWGYHTELGDMEKDSVGRVKWVKVKPNFERKAC